MKHPRSIVKKLDPKLEEDSGAFMAAMVLIASTQVGPNVEKIAKRTGLKRAVVREYGKRIRGNGIWQGGKIACDWFDKDGGIAFWCDVAVAEGLMNRA
jgi:hypothetical protein